MQDGWKAVWSIPYVSVVFFPSLKQNFIAYRSSKMSDCIFEIHHLWQSGFSRVYFNCRCSCSFEPEIIKIGHNMYSNNIVNFQESTTILNAGTNKKSLETYRMHRVCATQVLEKPSRKNYITESRFLTLICNSWETNAEIVPTNTLSQSAWTVEYTDCFSEERYDHPPMSVLDMILSNLIMRL